MLTLLTLLVLVAIGVVGAFVASFGASGGTLAVILLELTVSLSPSTLVGSLYIMFTAAALVSIFAYTRSGLIDLRSGLWLGLITVPGGFVGSYIGTWLTQREFNLGLGALVITLAFLVFVVERSLPSKVPGRDASSELAAGAPGHGQSSANGGHAGVTVSPGGVKTVTDKLGRRFVYRPRYMVMAVISAFLGVLGGAFGAGPVAVTTPSLIIFGGFPPQVAIATASTILLFMNVGVLGAHLEIGAIDYLVGAALAAGAIMGRLLGAHLVFILSPKVNTIVLAVGLLILGVYLVGTAGLIP